MCIIFNLAKANIKIKKLEAQLGEPAPPPPQGERVIDSNALAALLRPYGIVLSGGPGDFSYKLMSSSEARAFIKWYKKNARIKRKDYTKDDRDCEDFAWICRAEALLWTESKYVWGYIEAEGIDAAYPFPNHGFNFLVTEDNRVWYYDPLEVAGPDDDLVEAYPVKCNMAKA